MTEIRIRDLLLGCEPGTPQTVGVMTVIPLLSDVEVDRIAPPEDVSVRTSNYGSVHMRNQGEKVAIVPHGSAWLTSEKAQDHAVTRGHLVPPQREVSDSDAVCVQQTQGGLISQATDAERHLLPLQVRRAGMASQGELSYGRIWGSISESRGGGHGNLIEFFRTFGGDLDVFLAQFEPVPRQVGAIILLDGKLVGVERVSSQEFWLKVWKPLIRDCYGSATLKISQGSSIESWPEIDQCPDLEHLVGAVEAAQDRVLQEVRGVVGSMLDEPFTTSSESQVGDLSLHRVENGQFDGEAVTDGTGWPYFSLLVKESWPSRERWHKAGAFSI